MSGEANKSQRFESLQTGLTIVSELESKIDDENYLPQLEQARSCLAKASREVDTAGFDRSFSQAMGAVSSVAVANGHDELAEDALELGSDEL